MKRLGCGDHEGYPMGNSRQRLQLGALTWELKAASDLWTGDIDGKSSGLVTTGLLGSIRWWFEVLVRGLGGSACDPSAKGKNCQDRKHCVVCELFGCTGWARKFRFDVLSAKDEVQRDPIKKGQAFKLRFTPLRAIQPQEWALLDLSLSLIAGYGAIGGKTVYKPSDEEGRQGKAHHQDFGLIEITTRPGGVPACSEQELKEYLRKGWSPVNQQRFAWASLANFWCVQERYLTRQRKEKSSFNAVLGREELKRDGQKLVTQKDKKEEKNGAKEPETSSKWLAGETGVSKKVFSFKQPARTFGFVNGSKNKGSALTLEFEVMKKRLKKEWPTMNSSDYATGSAILDKLLEAAESSL